MALPRWLRRPCLRSSGAASARSRHLVVVELDGAVCGARTKGTVGMGWRAGGGRTHFIQRHLGCLCKHVQTWRNRTAGAHRTAS